MHAIKKHKAPCSGDLRDAYGRSGEESFCVGMASVRPSRQQQAETSKEPERRFISPLGAGHGDERLHSLPLHSKKNKGRRGAYDEAIHAKRLETSRRLSVHATSNVLGPPPGDLATLKGVPRAGGLLPLLSNKSSSVTSHSGGFTGVNNMPTQVVHPHSPVRARIRYHGVTEDARTNTHLRYERPHNTNIQEERLIWLVGSRNPLHHQPLLHTAGGPTRSNAMLKATLKGDPKLKLS